MIRNDVAALLAGREAEVALARQLNDQDAAESSIVNALCRLGRYAEAEQRGQAMLARIDADGSGRNANLPWVIGALLAALTSLGRLAQAQALLPCAFAAGRRFTTPTMWPQFCLLAVAEERYLAAAQLLGYTRQCFESRSITFEPDEEGSMLHAEALACAALGPEQLQARVQHGRTLDEAAAEALAAGAMP